MSQKSLKRKISGYREEYGILPTDQEIFEDALLYAWSGIKSYELAILLGYHYGDWKKIRALATNYTKRTGTKIIVVPSKRYLTFFIEEHYNSYRRYYLKMKNVVKDHIKSGDIEMPQELVEATAERLLKAKEKRKQRIMEKKEAKLELLKTRKEQALGMEEHLGHTFTNKTLADFFNITVPGAKKVISKWLTIEAIKVIRVGQPGRGNGTLYEFISK